MRQFREWAAPGQTRYNVGYGVIGAAILVPILWFLAGAYGLARPVVPPTTLWFHSHWEIPVIFVSYCILLAWTMLRHRAGQDYELARLNTPVSYLLCGLLSRDLHTRTRSLYDIQ